LFLRDEMMGGKGETIHLTLAEHFILSAREHRGLKCICDWTGVELSYGQALTAAVALAGAIEKQTKDEGKIGVLLPTSVGGALVNIAVTLLGKVAVNLNYSASEGVVRSAVDQCEIKTIITSRKFAEKLAKFEGVGGMVFIEDIKKRIGLFGKLGAYLKGRFWPVRILANAKGHEPDDIATIIFSSGSSGEPKGVMLSHNNIYSNINAIRGVFLIGADDTLCAVLPFFHSFGFTCGLWLPLLIGASVGYAANPLDGKMVGKVAHRCRPTILFAAPTFLMNYVRRVEREDFSNLWLVVAGAERLKVSIADAFEEKFGVRPQEGYGATELSPAVSINCDEEQSAGDYKAGRKEGTVGRPLPGIEVKTVSVEDGSELGVGKSGVLLVKGPNVMLGYLNRQEKTREVLKDGWYNTGDIGRVDEDGFIVIEGRLSRFSKIGGEMVPHLGVEQVYLNALGTDEQLVVVTSVPDAKKGEELVVLFLHSGGDGDSLHKIISESDLPNVWKPKRENYVMIEEMPLLGTGKLDIMQLQRIAAISKHMPKGR